MMYTLLVAVIILDDGLALPDDIVHMTDEAQRHNHMDNEGDAFLQSLCTFHLSQKKIKTQLYMFDSLLDAFLLAGFFRCFFPA